MLVLGLGLAVFAIGLFCRLLFTLSTYALPAVAGLMAGLSALGSKHPLPVSLVVAVIAGFGALALGWFVMATSRSPVVRSAVALLFALPAGMAGYHLATGLGGVGLAGPWLQALGVAGGLASAVTAGVRMIRFDPARGRNGAVSAAP